MMTNLSNSKDFSGAILIDANLRGADLRGANLESANLIGATIWPGWKLVKVE